MKVGDFTQPIHEQGPRQTMAHMDYQTRVQKGRALEPSIIKAVRSKGIKTRDATRHEDMHKKIDFWIESQGQWYSVQIKQREGGDDIIFEVYKDAYNETQPPNGRDYRGDAQLYLAVDTAGRGWLANKNALKKVVDEYLQQFGVESSNYKGVQFKRTNDRNTGYPKLMAFFPPNQYGKRLF